MRAAAKRTSAKLGAKTRPAIRRIRVKPPWQMSGRTAIVALVLSALALSYAYPVRTYLEQRSEINALQEAQSQQRERIEELEDERTKWEDPEYVRAQARDRLLLVAPGEELVIIIDDPEGAAADSGESPEPEPEQDWYEDLWDSFAEADQTGPS